MLKNIVRAGLIWVILAGLIGLNVPDAAHAGGSGHWVELPPVLDGTANAGEWGGSLQLTFTHYLVRYENDDQFMYFLIDATGEAPASPPTLSNGDDFGIYVDANQDGTQDWLYYLSYSSPNPLYRSTFNGASWSAGVPCQSYGAAGFGPSLSSTTPHRFYEIAIRLSEVNTLVGHSLTTTFLVVSQSPAFMETSVSQNLGMVPPMVAFIYNTPAGYADAQAFNTILYNTAGIWAEYVPLGQVELTDFHPYRAILVGDDTSDSSGYNWLGTAAAVQKIRQSGKPVLGIDRGGLSLFSALGLYLTAGQSWSGASAGIKPSALQHPAWTTPGAVSLAATVSLYTSPVVYHAVYIGDTDFPALSTTLLGVDTGSASHFAVLGQRANNTCYTLWGFRSSPGSLTSDGRKLLANLAWHPMCMPSVLYLGGSDTTLRDGLDGLMAAGGFPYTNAAAASAASLDFRPYERLLIGGDTEAAWSYSNIMAVSASHLPVMGLGLGGAHYFQNLLLPMAASISWTLNGENQADLANPLQHVMRYPQPVAVDSTLRADFDNFVGGAILYMLPNPVPNRSESVIAYQAGNHIYHSMTTQAFRGACYQLYGFTSYASNMTPLAIGLFRNMLAEPQCNNPVYVPTIRR